MNTVDFYKDFALELSKADFAKWGRIRPGDEWLKNAPPHWTDQHNRRADSEEDWRREYVHAWRSLPADTSDAVIQAEAFAGVLRRAVKVVLPEFDLCGLPRYLGELRKAPAPDVALDGPDVDSFLMTRPRRSHHKDHAVGETRTFLRDGVGGKIRQVEAELAKTTDPGERDFLQGMSKVLRAFSEYIAAHAEVAERGGRSELAASLRHLALQPPRTFCEALQLIWFRHTVFVLEDRNAMAFGRSDQHLIPFYQRDVKNGLLTREKAFDLLCQWLVFCTTSFNIATVTIGGLTPEGEDATNDVTYLIMEAVGALKQPSFNLFARFHSGSPREYLAACARLAFSGGGMPAMINDDLSVVQMRQFGAVGADANDHCFTGCAHLSSEGQQAPLHNPSFSLPDIVMAAFNECRGLAETERSYERLWELVKGKLADHVRTSAENEANRLKAKQLPDLFLSAFIDDCIGAHCEHILGGARYLALVNYDIRGLGLSADILATTRKLVFSEKRVSFQELCDALDRDYRDAEALRRQLLNDAPKFGNDEDEVDAIAVALYDWTVEQCAVNAVKTAPYSRLVPRFPGGSHFLISGKSLGATPDGRRAREPLSDAGSPMAGRDKKGVTALLNSYGKFDHSHSAGLVLNVRIDAGDFKGEAGIAHFLAIMDVMRAKGIQELQFNSVSNQELRAAQAEPQKHENLTVRVAGFSARFTQLGRDMQDNIIARSLQR